MEKKVRVGSRCLVETKNFGVVEAKVVTILDVYNLNMQPVTAIIVEGKEFGQRKLKDDLSDLIEVVEY